MTINNIFVIFCMITMVTFQYIIPALIIFVFSFRTVFHFLKQYFRKNETGFELSIALRLFLIFLIFIANNSAFHLFSIKIVLNFSFDTSFENQDPCLTIPQNWVKYCVFAQLHISPDNLFLVE